MPNVPAPRIAPRAAAHRARATRHRRPLHVRRRGPGGCGASCHRHRRGCCGTGSRGHRDHQSRRARRPAPDARGASPGRRGCRDATHARTRRHRGPRRGDAGGWARGDPRVEWRCRRRARGRQPDGIPSRPGVPDQRHQARRTRRARANLLQRERDRGRGDRRRPAGEAPRVASGRRVGTRSPGDARARRALRRAVRGGTPPGRGVRVQALLPYAGGSS